MRLLDLFCCAGGAAEGYTQAGFQVTGVDISPQPNYQDDFIQADVMALTVDFLRSFDAIHASPPCQHYSPLNAYNHKDYPDLIEPVRAMLVASGRPYIMENVPQAPLLNPTILCGGMFNLRVYRHRGFETSFAASAPEHMPHVAICARNGYLPSDGQNMTVSGGRHSEAWRARAAVEMGLPWTKTIREVCEAIPPAYTKHLGLQMMERLL